MLTTRRILEAHGLRAFDVEEFATHGGSLRVYACRAEDQTHEDRSRASQRVIERKKKPDSIRLQGYNEFCATGASRPSLRWWNSFSRLRGKAKQWQGYGAPGKSATLLHYCGIGKDLIEYTVDRSPHKQGRFLPGSHIPIYHPDRIRETKPDYVVILPWNLKDEIMEQLQFIREWGGRFVVPIPEVTVY